MAKGKFPFKPGAKPGAKPPAKGAKPPPFVSSGKQQKPMMAFKKGGKVK